MVTAEEVEVRSTSPLSARVSYLVLGFGLVFVLLHAVGIIDPQNQYALVVAALLAVVATIVGLRRSRPEPLWPWLAVAGALGLFLVADVLRVVLGTELADLSASRSLVPDWIALPGYLVLAIGVAGLAGVGSDSRDDLDAVVDGLIVALAVLVLAWTYLVVPALSSKDVGITTELLLAAYPVASVFVFATGVRLLWIRSRRTPVALWLCMGAIFFLLLGDIAYALLNTGLVDFSERLAGVPYSFAFLFYSAAVLHPSVRRVAQTRSSDLDAPTKGRLALVAFGLFVPALILVTGAGDMETADRVALSVFVVALMAVAVWRTVRALREHATSQARLAYQATHDALTGLPNRILLNEDLERVIEAELESGGSVTVLHVDIDRFKLVNDTMGHPLGDALLEAVARRLSRRVRAEDVVARIGGDEFAVMISGLLDEAMALDFGERTRLMFKEPFEIDGTDIGVTVSVGVAFAAAGRGAKDVLLRDADTAVNHAKTGGGDAVAIFDTSMRDRVSERLQLERALRHALERGELHLAYQPKIRLSDRRVVGLEALLRWEHPELGTVRPDKFIAIAEDTGMIVEIGAWVIDQACAELARLRNTFRDAGDLCVSVNVSARQLRSDSLLDTISQALLRHRIPPQSLCLELTESILMENLEVVSGELAAIRGCGSRISIDDFGTGYSSLAYLSKLPVDELKIDRSFVKELDVDPNAASLVQAVVFIASSLGITSVAEGVETVAQADKVGELGCTEVQGFLFARPLRSEDLDAKLLELGLHAVPHLRSVPTTPSSVLGIA